MLAERRRASPALSAARPAPRVQLVAHIAVSIDGQTQAAGPPAMFGGPADRARMVRRRAACDAVLVGGRTFCAWPIPPRIRRAWLPEAPERPTPPTYVVTQQDRLTPRAVHDGFRESGAELHIFGPNNLELPTALRGHAAAHPGPGDPLDAALAAAEDAGHQRILIEGGWGIIRALADRGRLDALHVTLCPLLIGDAGPAARPAELPTLGGTRAAARPSIGERPMRLLRTEEQDGALFLHFVREG